MEIIKPLNTFATALILSALASNSSATTLTYTQDPGGTNTIALGYPVPQPINSLTPVAGFRSYNSLHARHVLLDTSSDFISAINVGTTRNGRTIWAYQFSDADALSSEGFIAEGGMLINGGIHAREWQSPEVLTAIMETLYEQSADQGYHQYILENARLVVIPVLNVDGFLQTQRYPTQVMNSTFSEDPAGWPRDGRMRRKNMLGVDELLSTEGDNLLGVDLNRNNNPFWASNTRSSPNTSSLVHHGASPGSEPEAQALYAAGALFAANQLRFYMDVHSFSQLYYISQTSDTRYNAIARQVAQAMITNATTPYQLSPDPANSGIGSTQDYFAGTYKVPSYTLEIEPVTSASQYGGRGVTHDGFILPASQIARVRTELARSSILGVYIQSGPASILTTRLAQSGTNATLATHTSLATNATSRTQTSNVLSVPTAGSTVTAEISFNKPMRLKTPAGDPTLSHNVIADMNPSISLEVLARDGSVTIYPFSLQNAAWLKDNEKQRYDYDRFRAEFVWPNINDWNELVTAKLSVLTTDLAGTYIDSNPTTVARFENGVWVGLENTFGVSADQGGSDKTFVLKSSGQAPIYHNNLVDQNLTVGQSLNYQLNANTFTDPENGVLSYQAKLTNGDALPSWLSFDVATQRFSGTPTSAGAFNVQVTAIDPDFNRTSAQFVITVSAATPPPSPRSGGGGSFPGVFTLLIGVISLLRAKYKR